MISTAPAASESAGRRSFTPRWSGLFRAVRDVPPVLVLAFFIALHVGLAVHGELSSIFFAVEQAVMVALFVARRRSRATSSRAWEWAVAGIGTWVPLLLQNSAGPFGPLTVTGILLQLTGLTCGSFGLLCLGRSFGFVAADRGLKSAGPYRLVRHPIYLAHLMTLLGVLLANPTMINAALEAIIVAAMMLRIAAEERVLRSTGSYQAYAATVRWRLVPGLY